jgi:hypothetical protein
MFLSSTYSNPYLLVLAQGRAVTAAVVELRGAVSAWFAFSFDKQARRLWSQICQCMGVP